MHSEPPLVSVIILCYNPDGYIMPCLRSVLNSVYPNKEVIVVDNASTDGSLSEVSSLKSNRLRIVRNQKNLGFAEGNNVGGRWAKGKYLVFLNQDTVVDREWLGELVDVVEADDTVGAVSCKVLSLDNPEVYDTAGHTIDILGFPYDRAFHVRDKGQYDKVEQIFGVNGAAFLVERELYYQLGGLDARFFLLYDETDLCWRIWLAGRRVVFSPASIVYHKGSVSRNREFNKYFMLRNQMRSLIKNHETWRLLLFFPLFLGVLSALTVIGLRQRRLTLVTSIFGATIWNLQNLGDSLGMRHNRPRDKVSNTALLKRGIIKPLSVREGKGRLTQALPRREVSANLVRN